MSSTSTSSTPRTSLATKKRDDLAVDHRDLVQRGLDLKKIGNSLVELVGGRAIHPVNVRVGKFYPVRPKPSLEPSLPG